MTALRAVLALIPLFPVLAAVAAEDRFTCCWTMSPFTPNIGERDWERRLL